MKESEQTAITVAEYLLQIKAIKLDIANPFTWTSGKRSPIYCDNRKTLSYPKIRTYIRQEFVNIINEEFASVDVIAGVATAGIPHGVLVAQDLGLPFVYVRSSQKKHGLENTIEGVIESGQSVVIVEDLVSTGKSSLNVANVLRDAGCEVKGMVAIFSYGLKEAIDSFKKAKVSLITLTDYDTLIQQAVEGSYIKNGDIQSLALWRQDPDTWGNNLK